MKPKHLAARVAMCLELAKLSNCPRRKFGALLIDPARNQVIAEGYNGGPRGGARLCGGDRCYRDELAIESGTRVEVGCVHAEMNVICNAAASHVSTSGAWLVVTGEPCRVCAKLIMQSGIARVYVVQGGYAGGNGVWCLRDNGVDVEYVDGPKDPRERE